VIDEYTGVDSRSRSGNKCTSLEWQLALVISELQDAVGWEATKVYLSLLIVSDALCKAMLLVTLLKALASQVRSSKSQFFSNVGDRFFKRFNHRIVQPPGIHIGFRED
jgi:hypothetical protein